MKPILTIIVLSQFLCTSLWFAGNAIMPDLIRHLQVNEGFLANITSAIQFGFIIGTLSYSIFTISDRFSPSKVFAVSAFLAAIFNLGINIDTISPNILLVLRFLTGFFLAGIYPIGIKIASDYYEKGLGKSLGFLVGALVLGTAFPHLIKSITTNLPWKLIAYATSLFSVLGGLLILNFVPDGPYRTASSKLNYKAFLSGFKNEEFRTVAFGYFGHMWELYTFWAFVPVMLAKYQLQHQNLNLNLPLLSFTIIAFGSLACVFSGIYSQKTSPYKLANIMLLSSCICCVISPLLLSNDSIYLLMCFLLFWGFVVIADSPLFSTLVAQNAPKETKGTSITIVNCIGFFITIVSIQFIQYSSKIINSDYIYMLLAIGPIIGLLNLFIHRPQKTEELLK
ncbi:MFS transporter [Flavobacterium undicola]|uniref:MFS transporter n=1 Tax=Flavobacterium undicola TaxID=1932779 RepID=UPI0013783EB1|nr:MFS transporter [Flavobacterium undicola]MBA0883069.1 MFS transporter [Flavobacterium undicola]